MRSASAPDSGTPASPALTPAAWSAIALGFAAMFFVMGSRSGFAVLYPRMVTDMGWSVSEVTGAFSAGLLVYAPMAVLAGVFLDRFGCRVSMVVGSVVIAVGLAIAAAATELWHLYVAFILTNGIGSPAIGFITVVNLLSQRAGPRFATAFGIAFTGQGAGSLVLSPALQFVIDASSWRVGALALGISLLVVLLPLVVLFAPGRRPPTERADAVADESTQHGGLLFVVFFVSNAGLGYLMLIPTHQVAYLLDLGLAPVFAATAAGAWGAMTSVGSLLGGWALDRWGLLGMISGACAVFAVGTVAMIWGGPAALAMVVLYVIASGVGRGMLSVVLGTAQTAAYAGPRLGRMTGLLDLGFGTGAFLGPWLTALGRDSAGSFAPGFLSAIVAAIVMAATSVLASRLVARAPRSVASAPQ